MDVRFCEGRNHRREAQVRAANTGEYGGVRCSEALVRRTVFSLDKDLHEVGYPEVIQIGTCGSVSTGRLVRSDRRIPFARVGTLFIGLRT
jgi:hypothetical protein